MEVLGMAGSGSMVCGMLCLQQQLDGVVETRKMVVQCTLLWLPLWSQTIFQPVSHGAACLYLMCLTGGGVVPFVCLSASLGNGIHVQCMHHVEL